MKRATGIAIVCCAAIIAGTAESFAEDMGEIACGQTLAGEIAVAAQKDSWTFSASAGDRVVLSVMATSGALNPHVIVYAPDGSQEAAALKLRPIPGRIAYPGTLNAAIVSVPRPSSGNRAF